MVCRLLKSLEGGQLPDNGGPLSVDGIVYISRSGSRPVNLPNIYTDLVKLLPDDRAARLEGLYKHQPPLWQRCGSCWRRSQAGERYCCWTTSRI